MLKFLYPCFFIICIYFPDCILNYFLSSGFQGIRPPLLLSGRQTKLARKKWVKEDVETFQDMQRKGENSPLMTEPLVRVNVMTQQSEGDEAGVQTGPGWTEIKFNMSKSESTLIIQPPLTLLGPWDLFKLVTPVVFLQPLPAHDQIQLSHLFLDKDFFLDKGCFLFRQECSRLVSSSQETMSTRTWVFSCTGRRPS